MQLVDHFDSLRFEAKKINRDHLKKMKKDKELRVHDKVNGVDLKINLLKLRMHELSKD